MMPREHTNRIARGQIAREGDQIAARAALRKAFA
jgi:hypothetical protein